MRRLGFGLGLAAAAGLVAVLAATWRPAIAPAVAGPFDPALVARGAQLAAIGDCAVCHVGPAPYAGGRAVQTPFGAVYASNITPDRQTGIGTWSQAAFIRAMREGVDRAGGFLYPAFPYNHYAHVDDADLAALYAFLMTRAPVAAVTPATRLAFPFNLRPLMAGWDLLFLREGPVATDPSRDAAWNRGAYLVEGLGHCGACHTPRNAFGAEETNWAYTGGQADGWDAPGLTAATSPAAIAWTVDALYAYLRHGIDDRHAASAGPMHAVSHNLSQVPEADVRAIATYVGAMTDPDGNGQDGGAREQRVAALVAGRPPSQAPMSGDASSEGAVIFAGACAQCHGAGAPMMLDGRPSLALGSSVTAPGPRNAVNTVLYGLQPAAGQRGLWMPGFEAALTDGQVAAVLRYLRARFTELPAWPAMEEQVRKSREESGS